MKIFNWIFSSFFRTLGRFLFYIAVALLAMLFISGKVHAETYNLDSSQVTSYYRVNNATLINLNYNNWYSIGSDILSNLRLGFTPLNLKTCTDYGCSEGLQPGQYLFDFYLLTDGSVNITNCNQLSSDFQNVNITTGNWVSNQITSSCVDVSTYVERGYATYLHILYSFTSDAFATEYRFYFNYGSGWLNGSSKFKVLLGNVYDFDQTIINDFKQQKLNEQQINQNNTIINQNQTIIDQNNQTNDKLDDLNDNLTSTEGANLGALQNSAGWLPAGPVDSILNLPLSLLNNLTTNLNKSCQPVILPIPYVNKDLTLPCVNTLYDDMGISAWVTTIGVIASAFIMFSYLVKLYKWVDDTLSFRENNSIDNWGGV